MECLIYSLTTYKICTYVYIHYIDGVEISYEFISGQIIYIIGVHIIRVDSPLH